MHVDLSSYTLCSRSVASVGSDSLRPFGLARLCPWDSPGKNAGAGSHALLQGISLIQESNQCPLRLLYCRQILHC